MFKKDIYLLPILPIRVTVKIDIEPLYIYFCAEKLILFRLPWRFRAAIYGNTVSDKTRYHVYFCHHFCSSLRFNPWEVLTSTALWKGRGHRSLPLPSPVLLLSFLSRIGFIEHSLCPSIRVKRLPTRASALRTFAGGRTLRKNRHVYYTSRVNDQPKSLTNQRRRIITRQRPIISQRPNSVYEQQNISEKKRQPLLPPSACAVCHRLNPPMKPVIARFLPAIYSGISITAAIESESSKISPQTTQKNNFLSCFRSQQQNDVFLQIRTAKVFLAT